MALHHDSSTPKAVVDELKEMKLESADSILDAPVLATITSNAVEDEGSPHSVSTRSRNHSASPAKSQRSSRSPAKPVSDEEKVNGDVTVKDAPDEAPVKLARSTSQNFVRREPQLFADLDDKTEEATSTFSVIDECHYANKYLGYTEMSMDCDCAEEWDSATSQNEACGDDSDCINRATKMECVGDCGCGAECQNQRFQNRQYADVSVIKTEKKGYGLRANTELRPNQFIFEYIGEVINEPTFRKRMIQYDEEGIKHFYFMSLSRGEFIDATKKGNLGRFCNHSCSPNCYVDKWVVGEKLRMGIFAERAIQAGEELVFNYNVDRYGANPQPCYCGEPNCTGYIGGKTQTEVGTKLSNATIEALGLEDGDDWDTAVPKKPRKRKTGEPDEEYVASVQPKLLDETGVTKVMATLMQCKEKWIAVKLLGRIQRSYNDERVINRVVRMHGYQILNSQLTTWRDDCNAVLQIFDVLDKFPRLTRNKIIDSKIEDTIKSLIDDEQVDERVQKHGTSLLEVWSKLEIGYRIPRRKRDPNATPAVEKSHRVERQDERNPRSDSKPRSKSGSRSRSRSADAPGGHRNHTNGPRRHFRPPRSQFHRLPPLPEGWFAALTKEGKTYYYNYRNEVRWDRPTLPAGIPPPPPQPPKASSKTEVLQKVIDSIIAQKSSTPKEKASQPGTPKTTTAQEPEKEKKKEGQEKWRKLSEEKQKKLYENTIFPFVKHVMDKYKHKLGHDDLKRFAKEVSKKLVSSDFKHKRVEDPTKITDHRARQVKKYVKEYLDKAVAKKREHDKKKASHLKTQAASTATSADVSAATAVNASSLVATPGTENKADESDDEVRLTDDEDVKENSQSPEQVTDNAEKLKRKRGAGESNDEDATGDDGTPNKRARSQTPPPPPPPPPPPAEDFMDSESHLVEEHMLAAADNTSEVDSDKDVAMQNYDDQKDLDLISESRGRVDSKHSLKPNGVATMGQLILPLTPSLSEDHSPEDDSSKLQDLTPERSAVTHER